jgi:hypothetical protein
VSVAFSLEDAFNLEDESIQWLQKNSHLDLYTPSLPDTEQLAREE